jgi:hypothetical protein
VPQPTAMEIPGGTEAPIPLRRTLLTAAALLLALCGVAAAVDLGRVDRVVVETGLVLPIAESAVRDDPSLVRYTPVFEVTEPSTLRIDLTRGAAPGWVAVDCALISEDESEVRTFQVASLQSDGASSTSSARIDQVGAGRYSVRLTPRYRPSTPGHGPLPSAQVRVVLGGRSGTPFLVATGLILIPAVFTTVRWARQRRRDRHATATATATATL